MHKAQKSEMKLLSDYEVQKRLLRFNLSGNWSDLDLGSIPPEQEVLFMYPHVITTSNDPNNRLAELEKMFGPLDETEEEYNERVSNLELIVVNLPSKLAQALELHRSKLGITMDEYISNILAGYLDSIQPKAQKTTV